MGDKHISSQFDAELTVATSRLMEMGGLVESQMRAAMEALKNFDTDRAHEVLRLESEVNAFEVEIDREISSIISRRQPTARDLRLLVAIYKATTNLERAGDEVSRIARMVLALAHDGVPRPLPIADLQLAFELAMNQLRKALDAFARMDERMALEILKEDDAIDVEFNGFMRKLVTYMMEDPRTISASLDLVFIAKAIERVGDHAKNLAEQIIFITRGTDIRHVSLEQVENAVR
ncbi:PhoU-like phosphate uptake regulator [Tibeticola sediminis]|jgi:phosphate transport system protein|uniref:Phosphate-specific transport system accessory protein PhoU n=1 Tax=Tibeticola sediminis TaxID=1917811 RepID=A0A3N4UR29_9BURK|nr:MULTISPECIES: phosphate signaling complex protein PhoU [Tibeticola]MCI4440079.1 phosphate signaling complex protein PhoU [Tibeticola sp.]RPE72488.1 PhoU-like phosphate uptake regulator [Tibeticola sediminis]